MRKTLIILGLVFGVLILGLAAGEFAARATHHPSQGGQGPFIPDSQSFYSLNPGWKGDAFSAGKPYGVYINNLGMRGANVARDSIKPVVLCLGDSMTYGVGVGDDETYPAALSKLIGDNQLVLNGGVIGYNLSQEYSYLAAIGEERKPATVTLGVFATNWEDLGNTTYVADAQGNLVAAQSPTKAAGNITGFFITHSKLAELAYMRMLNARKNKASEPWERLGTITKNILLGQTDPRTEHDWMFGISLLQGMDSMTKGWNGKFVVIYIPIQDQLARPELDKLHDRLLTSLNDLKIPTLDLLPLFRENSDPNALYLAGDGNLSVEGNRIVAEALQQFLQSH